METLALALFLFFSAAAVLSHFLGFPGNWAILVFSLLLAWSGEFSKVQVPSLTVLLSLALLGEIIEFIVGMVVAKKSKASNSAIASSFIFGMIGAILGVPFLFGAGSVIGAFIGAFTGAFIAELFMVRDLRRSIRAAWGTLLGKVGGLFTKTIIGTVMIVVVVTDYFN